MSDDHPSGLPIRQPHGSWVQTDRDTHRLWAELIAKSPVAARAMHIITSHVGELNAFLISQEQLAGLIGCSPRRLRDALKLLEAGNWLEVRRVGNRGTVAAYVVNDRVAWTGGRSDKRSSLVTGRIWIAGDEQDDVEMLGNQPPLRRLPDLYPHERQMPAPYEPEHDGGLPDIPARVIEARPQPAPARRLMRDPDTGVIYDQDTGEVVSLPHRG